MRRPNGAGCIRKLSGKRRKPYAVYVTTGWDEEGNQKQEFLGTFARRTDAEKYLNEYDGVVPDTINATVESVYKRWIKSKTQLSKSGLDCYKAAWKWMDNIKDIKVREVRPQDLQTCVDKAVKEGRGRDTCENIRTVSHGIFNLALKENICHKDVSKFLVLPSAEKPVKSIFSDAEIELLKNQNNDIWAESILVMIYTGMRVSEMLGLTKDNIDLINKKITGAGIKTEAGKDREIPIHSYLMPIFKKALLSNAVYFFAASEKNKLRPEHYRTRYFQPLMERLGMNHSPHECRHTTASLLVRNQVPPELAKYILGHAQYSTTMDIYNHPQDNDLLKAVNKL